MWLRLLLFVIAFSATAPAGTFGTVVPIGGHASDLALDEARGVLYVANFTANRIEIVTLSDLRIHSAMNVPAQPGALALSPDGQYLVVVHFGNFQAPNAPANALTVIRPGSAARQSFALGSPPLGIAFGIDGRALVVTTDTFLLFDPASGATQVIDTVAGVTAKTLPVPPVNFPPQIIAAAVAASGDGLSIYGLTDTIRFRYDVQRRQVMPLGYTSSPPMGPRVVSVNRDGSVYTAGWGLFDRWGTLLSQFANPAGLLNVGSHAIDSTRGLIYAQIPQAAGSSPDSASAAPPVLQIVDADNLALREQLRLPENLAGHSVLDRTASVLYAVSDSGAMVLPVGSLGQWHRISADREDLVFRGNLCDRHVLTQDLVLRDPGGGRTDFTLAVQTPGVSVSPASGSTPATIRVSVDPTAFQSTIGTTAARLQIVSSSAVNLPAPVRLLIHNHEPDQRGDFVDVPGQLVDILPDPSRSRFYILRQDQNQVLVFDGVSKNRIATLRTANTPTQMAITRDGRYLLVGHDNAQIATLYNLDTLLPDFPIVFPGGHYPRSLAASGKAILAACRVAGPIHTIDRVDLPARIATAPPTLGVYENTVHINTALTAAPNGSSILAAMADGTVLLYDATADTFTVSRKDFTALAGAYAASNNGSYLVDHTLLNASLVPVGDLDTSTGSSSGFVFLDQSALRATTVPETGPGVLQRVDLATRQSIRPTRMTEAPLLGNQAYAFTRTLAVLADRSAILSLTTSGFTVLPWDYDAAIAPPHISRIVSAADFSLPVAPGGLITLFGDQLSPVELAATSLPLPADLGNSCLTVNGMPAPLLFVSPGQINAQLPFIVEGMATLVLRTPGGVTDSLNLTVSPTAPSIFHSGTAGPDTGLATVVRADNNELVTGSNPIHPGDQIIIYATGLGRTLPAVEAGAPAPESPLSEVILPPAVELGGVSLALSYAGLAPGQVGVYQINAAVPSSVPLGMSIPLTISQSGGSTSLPVRVVR